MKAAVALLIILGLVAAVCATVLVQMLVHPRTSVVTETDTEPEITLLTAGRDLNAMTVIDGATILTKKVKKSQVPEGALTNSVQVVGKVLARPMVEGEVFSKSCFAQEGVGLYLASALPPGKRAVSISLRDHSGMVGILYPGSVVDVLVSLEAPGNDGVATTLLQGLQVLAIGSQSVTSEQEYKDKAPGALSTRGQVNFRMVTLLVTPKQAEILQLATQYGQVALSMRNPLDTAPVAQDLTRVSEFTDSASARAMGAVAQATAAFLRGVNGAAQRKASEMPAGAQASAKSPADPFGPTTGQVGADTGNPLWEMLIVRGTTQERRSFPMSEVEQNKANPAPAPAPQKLSGSLLSAD